MKLRKISCFTIVLALLAIFSLSGQALAAGGPEPPPPGYVASGPEFWGVVIMKCRPGLNNDTVNIRFKRVVDCNVETEVLIDEGFGLGCPPDAAGAVGQTLPAGTVVFGKATPYTTKVKNFTSNPDPNNASNTIVSFDAQFKYWNLP